MNKKIPLGAAIAFMVVIAGITFCITMMVSLNHFNKMVLNVKAREEMYKKLADVDRSARQNFSGIIDEEILADNISAGYIRGLGDKNSSYVTKNDYEYLMLQNTGQLGQIGVKILADQTGYFLITEVLDGSPAFSAGIEVNDMLISIDNVDMQGVSQAAAERLLQGQIGNKISVVTRRDGVDKPNDLQRKAIPVQYVVATRMDATGYIKISSFVGATAPQFKSAVDRLLSEGVTSLVFDLRNNNSDSIESAVSMLNTLLPAGDLGTYKNSKGKVESIGQSDQYAINNLPISVIINSKTGNAAEYFAATLRDFGAATIVGVQSMGKAIRQELIKLTDGSAINLTTANIYPPSGTEIHGVGVKPDYDVKLTTEQEQSLETLEPASDTQLQKALEVVKSKVYE